MAPKRKYGQLQGQQQLQLAVPGNAYYNNFRGSDQIEAMNNDYAVEVRSLAETTDELNELDKEEREVKEALYARVLALRSTLQSAKEKLSREKEPVEHLKRLLSDLTGDKQCDTAPGLRSSTSESECSLTKERAILQRSYDDAIANKEEELQMQLAEKDSKHRKQMDQRDEEHRSSLEVAISQREQALERAQRLSESRVKIQRIIENLEAQVKSLQQQEEGSREQQRRDRKQIEDLEKGFNSMKDSFANDKHQALTAQRARSDENKDKALHELCATLERHASREKDRALSKLQNDLSEKHTSALEELRVEVLATATKQKDKALLRQKDASDKDMAEEMKVLRSQLKDEYKAQQDKALSRQQQRIEKFNATTKKREMQELEAKLHRDAKVHLETILSTHRGQADARLQEMDSRLRNVTKAQIDEIEKYRSKLEDVTSEHTQELMDVKRKHAASLDKLAVEKATLLRSNEQKQAELDTAVNAMRSLQVSQKSLTEEYKASSDTHRVRIKELDGSLEAEREKTAFLQAEYKSARKARREKEEQVYKSVEQSLDELRQLLSQAGRDVMSLRAEHNRLQALLDAGKSHEAS